MYSTNDLIDGYMGSGVLLKHSIKKYGADNHITEILAFADNRQMLSEVEKGVVTIEMLKDDKCLNLKEGGDGGYMSTKHSLALAKSKKRKNRYRDRKPKSKSVKKRSKNKKSTKKIKRKRK